MLILKLWLCIALLNPTNTWADDVEASPALPLKVAVLHPILGDMARFIGGEHVIVVDLLKSNGNLHAFEPSPRDLAQTHGARFLFASGKNIEPWLPELQDSMSGPNSNPCQVIELGKRIPDVLASGQEHDINPTNQHDSHGDLHHHGVNDPHWWHTPNNMKRAARQICAAFSQADPTHEKEYRGNLNEWNQRMDALDAWARVQLAALPVDRRVIVVGHAAMGHFCHAYGLTEWPIQGINREDESTSIRLASTLQKLRQLNIVAIFPEYSANPKSLEQIAATLHIPLASPLVTDGLAPHASTFESMFRYNVGVIARALAPNPSR